MLLICLLLLVVQGLAAAVEPCSSKTLEAAFAPVLLSPETAECVKTLGGSPSQLVQSDQLASSGTSKACAGVLAQKTDMLKRISPPCLLNGKLSSEYGGMAPPGRIDQSMLKTNNATNTTNTTVTTTPPRGPVTTMAPTTATPTTPAPTTTKTYGTTRSPTTAAPNATQSKGATSSGMLQAASCGVLAVAGTVVAILL